MSEPHHHPKPGTHAHDGEDLRSGERRRIGFVLALTAAVMAAEIAGGIFAHSLALLSDALHMLTDLGSAGLTYMALVVAARPASPEKTYRNWRVEVLAALFNGLAFLPLSAFLFYEAWGRWRHPVMVDPLPVLVIAGVGFLASAASAAALHRHARESINLRGAFLHVVGDSLSSLGVMASGALLWLDPRWTRVDPLVAASIGAMVLFWALRLVRDSVRILLESAPAHLSLDQVRLAMQEEAGVAGVHDLHIWTITSKMHALTAHVLLAQERSVEQCQELCRRLTETLDRRFDINHVTLQFEMSHGDSVCCEHDRRLTRGGEALTH